MLDDDVTGGWYGKAKQYWSRVPATIDGVLGGEEHVHEIDIRESRAFLESVDLRGRERALDCAAGIGRVSKHLLCPLFKITDVMEPRQHLLETAKSQLSSELVGDFMLDSMERVTLRHQYDVIVMQWAAGYLPDTDFVSFLSRCKAALKPHGIVFLKDNLRRRSALDEEEGCVTRSDKSYKAIFSAAGLTCIKECRQREWPEDLLPVKMYALR
jgi:protein N-terminal methyltransferase